MNNTLRTLFHELERFGTENDSRVSQHHERMLNITPETGQFLAILILMAKAKRVLEIGTSNGYSTLWLADAVQATSGKVDTVEHFQAKADLARRNFERAGLSQRIQQYVMDAGQFLHQQPSCAYELVFLDSNRDDYLDWWTMIQDVLAPGGMLVVDNVVSHASQLKPFITQVQTAPGWRSVIVPVGKGELLALNDVM